MDCIEAQGCINSFIDDTLDETALKGFLEHVRCCPSCYDDLEVSFTVMSIVRYLDDTETNHNFVMELEHRIAEKELWLKQQERARIFKSITGFLCVLAVLSSLFSVIMFISKDRGPKNYLTVPVYNSVNNTFNLHKDTKSEHTILYIQENDSLYEVPLQKSLEGEEGWTKK